LGISSNSKQEANQHILFVNPRSFFMKAVLGRAVVLGFIAAFCTACGGGGGSGDGGAPPAPPTSVTDIDGNIYDVVQIGTQLWMRENLQTTRYRDGSDIIHVTDTREWINLVNTSTGAYCNLNNDVTKMMFGRYYNYFAVADSRSLCPEGWHVPTDNEWKTLELFLGMSQDEIEIENNWRGTDEGGKLKSNTWWNSPNIGATNESGFTALPGGRRNDSGIFLEAVIYGNWWSATEHDTYTASDRRLSSDRSTIFRRYELKNYGQSVRCVKD
jgi:uncharacterized protein (TIGR02145 family)